MILVSVWNPKGGQGKTTLAINLCAAAVELKIKPILICLDPQGTSLLYYREGNLSFEVLDKIPISRPDSDIVIFDSGANDWEVPKTYTIVMPTRPVRDQYSTYIYAYKKAEALQKRIITVVTDFHSHRIDERTTTEALQKNGAFVIPSSGAFSKAAAEYLTIFDQKMNTTYKISERRLEITNILKEMIKLQ
jgi:chromosome partitioning protein